MNTRLQLRPALVLFVVLTAVTGVAYPLVVTGIAKARVPGAGRRQPDRGDGKPVGSALIGQTFSDPKYFWGRPSATARWPTTRARRAARTRAAEPGAGRCGQGPHRGAAGRRSRATSSRCRSTWSPRRRAAWTRTSASPRRGTRRARRARCVACARRRSSADRAAHRRAAARLPRRAARQRARAEPGAGPAASAARQRDMSQGLGMLLALARSRRRSGSPGCWSWLGAAGRAARQRTPMTSDIAKALLASIATVRPLRRLSIRGGTEAARHDDAGRLGRKTF